MMKKIHMMAKRAKDSNDFVKMFRKDFGTQFVRKIHGNSMQQPWEMLRIICVFSIGFDVASFAWTAVSCLILHRFVIIFPQKLHRVLTILPLKVDFKSMLILSFVFYHFLERFRHHFGIIWAPLGVI